jgi:hypothetical protein
VSTRRPCSPDIRSAALGKPRANSFDVDHQFLDDRPPFLDIGLLPCVETFGGLLRARKDLKPKFRKSRLYRRISQSFHSHGIELGDDVPRGVFGREKPVPGTE